MSSSQDVTMTDIPRSPRHPDHWVYYQVLLNKHSRLLQVMLSVRVTFLSPCQGAVVKGVVPFEVFSAVHIPLSVVVRQNLPFEGSRRVIRATDQLDQRCIHLHSITSSYRLTILGSAAETPLTRVEFVGSTGEATARATKRRALMKENCMTERIGQQSSTPATLYGETWETLYAPSRCDLTSC